MIETLLINVGIYALSGTLAGLIAGLFGIGGGLVMIPALVFIFMHDPTFPPALIMHMAVGTSLAIMVVTAQAVVRTHSQSSALLWGVFRRLFPGLACGAIAGALIGSYLPTQWLERVFGVFLLWIAVRLMLTSPVNETRERVSFRISHGIIFLIGSISGLLGIGGGTLMVPYLNHYGFAMRNTVALSALSTMVVAWFGTLIVVMMGWNERGLPLYSTGYVYWPAVLGLSVFSALAAPIGTRLMYKLSPRRLHRLFIVLLFIIAFSLLI